MSPCRPVLGAATVRPATAPTPQPLTATQAEDWVTPALKAIGCVWRVNTSAHVPPAVDALGPCHDTTALLRNKQCQ